MSPGDLVSLGTQCAAGLADPEEEGSDCRVQSLHASFMGTLARNRDKTMESALEELNLAGREG